MFLFPRLMLLFLLYSFDFKLHATRDVQQWVSQWHFVDVTLAAIVACSVVGVVVAAAVVTSLRHSLSEFSMSTLDYRFMAFSHSFCFCFSLALCACVSVACLFCWLLLICPLICHVSLLAFVICCLFLFSSSCASAVLCYFHCLQRNWPTLMQYLRACRFSPIHAQENLSAHALFMT